MNVTMAMTELVFKCCITLLIQYDSNKNIPMLTSYCDYHVTKVFGRLYKCFTGFTDMNLSHQEKHLLWRNYVMGEIMLNFLLQLPRCNIIPKHLYIIYVSQLKVALCKFVNMKLKFTVKQSETNYRQQ